jgi:hypothetical protein
MARETPNIDTRQASDPVPLTERILNATALESIDNDDGSTTIYLNVHKRERFSTLPRLAPQTWFARVLGNRGPTSEQDRLGAAANLRRVPRRRSDLI